MLTCPPLVCQQTLTLVGNLLRGAAAAALGRGLREGSRLLELDLGDNGLGDQARRERGGCSTCRSFAPLARWTARSAPSLPAAAALPLSFFSLFFRLSRRGSGFSPASLIFYFFF